MAIITFPSSARIARIAWSLDRPAQLNRSQWSGKDQVIADPWHSRWRAEVELAPIVGEANVLAWRSFLAQLKGPINTFRLPLAEGSQASTVKVVAAATVAAGATSIPFHSGPASTTLLAAGRMISTAADQPLILTAAATTNGIGQGTFTFEPALRAQVTNGSDIQVQAPTALVALTGSTAGWSVDRGQVYGIAFSAEERY